MRDLLQTAAELEHVVGGRQKAAMLKSIAFLDDHCTTFLECSPLAVLGTFDRGRTARSRLFGGIEGHLHALDPLRLALPADEFEPAEDGAPAGLLAFVPGYGETLRINGRVRLGAEPHLEVEEAFLHCAKAILRSRLWDEPTSAGEDHVGDHWTDLLGRSPFITLATVDASDAADVSPKGDPAGFVLALDHSTVAIPDRPGNRRTDTLHNLVDRPALSLLAMVPGDDRVVELRGQARITSDADLCERLAVNGKTPKAAMVLEVADVDVRAEPGLAASGAWDPARRVAPDALPRASCIWVDHVKLNDDPSLMARTARRTLTERVMAAGIKKDYASNLY